MTGGGFSCGRSGYARMHTDRFLSRHETGIKLSTNAKKKTVSSSARCRSDG